LKIRHRPGVSVLYDRSLRPKKKITMFPPERPGEFFFPLTRARTNSTIPFLSKGENEKSEL